MKVCSDPGCIRMYPFIFEATCDQIQHLAGLVCPEKFSFMNRSGPCRAQFQSTVPVVAWTDEQASDDVVQRLGQCDL